MSAWRILILAVAVLGGVVACGQPGADAPEEDALHGSWTLTDAGGLFNGDQHDVSLHVGVVELSGSAPCNRYGAEYDYEGGVMELDLRDQTEVACEAETMKAEDAYLAALEGSHTVRLEGQTLIMDSEGTTLRFERADNSGRENDSPLASVDRRIDDDEWVQWTTDDGLGSDNVFSLAGAEDGALWAAGGGVARFDGNAWTTYTSDEGVADDSVFAVATGPDGAVWAATHSGVSRFDGKEWISWTSDDGLTHDWASWVGVGADGTVWVATAGGPTTEDEQAVARFDGGQWTTWTADDRFPIGAVRSWAVGADGALWAATPGAATPEGVTRFDGDTWTTYTTADGLAHADVETVAAGDDGTVWAGTRGGVSRFEGDHWKSWTADDGLAEDAALWLHADKGTVWAASPRSLSHFDGDRWTGFVTGHPELSSTNALTVADDSVWVATDAGVLQWSP